MGDAFIFMGATGNGLASILAATGLFFARTACNQNTIGNPYENAKIARSTEYVEERKIPRLQCTPLSETEFPYASRAFSLLRMNSKTGGALIHLLAGEVGHVALMHWQVYDRLATGFTYLYYIDAILDALHGWEDEEEQ